MYQILMSNMLSQLSPLVFFRKKEITLVIEGFKNGSKGPVNYITPIFNKEDSIYHSTLDRRRRFVTGYLLLLY